MSVPPPPDGPKLRVAVIGQSNFALEVYSILQLHGHVIVGVFTIPDKGAKEEPVAAQARADGVPVFKYKAWRRAGKAIPEVLEEYKATAPDLNVLPFCSQFIPTEVAEFPRLKTIVYHPSLLPRHRGASAINWTLAMGDERAGFSIFWADDGLDTGPLLLTRETEVLANDTVTSLYTRFMYPEGIRAMAEAVDLIAAGLAPKIQQPEVGATYDPMLNKKELSRIDFSKNAWALHNWIRGMDSVPGAWAVIGGQEVTCFGAKIWDALKPPILRTLEVEGCAHPALVHLDGVLLTGSDGDLVNVERVKVGSKVIPGCKLGSAEKVKPRLDYTAGEEEKVEAVRKIWQAILMCTVENDTDFFAAGGSSMNVVRLVEEAKDRLKVDFKSDDLFMAPTFDEFAQLAIERVRGGGGGPAKEEVVEYDAVTVKANGMTLRFPHQLFIDGCFCDATGGLRRLRSINPADESLICEVESASAEDVNRAVLAAQMAFERGPWGSMNARERGRLLYRLADLMEAHREELATLESLDSGAVYTLALKTHIGMSIDTWRYFAGWCDKIQGSTIPINNARPNHNLTITKKEPIGVVGLITPWNYPLMMLSWKMAACLAAGNTCVMKPAQVSPLTALKFAELTVKAGIPPGVVNILPGSGSVCGQAIADHPLVRKLGFTGSTEVGKHIMASCAGNVKKVSLELGGKSPLIIFADSDLERSVKQAIGGVFFNKGENCIAAGRVFVENSIHDEFVAMVVDEVRKMTMGDPLDRGTAHGPQNHRAHLEKLVQYCKKGVEEGARLVLGGKQADRPGLFFEPTIFTEVKDDMFVAREESFGPIMIISRFHGDVDLVVRRANATEFGLASGVFTRDINKALYVAEKIHAGTCFVNTYNKTDVAAPFGGFRQSGFGKDLGQEALNEYLVTKTITFEFSV
mmetsp:Transcript_39544/g.99689  ORF Transcript_39544/g.99689 Transcript_39544/m.99689 type:complete len:917 (+) Transcript_39544:144-2894(+)